MRACRSSLLAVVLSLVAVSAFAQTEMRYYVMPKIGDGLSPPTAFRPKYIDPGSLSPTWNVGAWQGMDYGLENVFVVALTLTPTDHTTLTAQPDVLAIPSPIANLVSALALPTVKSKCEAANLPADWVTTSLTYQQVLSRILRIVSFMQRFHGMFGRLFNAGVTLDTRINQLPVTARQDLNNAAISLGADTSTITGTTLIREALVIVGDQLFPGGLAFGGTTF